MKTKTILSVLTMAAVTFGFTACTDTDAQYSIPSVDAPKLVKTTPETGAVGVKRGDLVIAVKYDKRVFFASKDMDKIQVTGATLKDAIVYGTDSVLTVTVSCPDRGGNVSVTIPEGVVTNGQGTPAGAVSLNYTTFEQDKQPVMAQSASAVKLYNYLAETVDNKILSGMMANVAWNTDCAEQVYQWTGKYPAINGFDYIHMPASEAGENWINYMDITPVKTWADNGGIVTIGWHWIVPRVACGEVAMPGDWSGSIQLTDESVKGIMANAAVGDKIVVAIKDVAEGAQGSVKNSSWTGFVDEAGTSWEYFDISGDSYSMTLDATVLADIQANGFIIAGHDYTVTGVYLVPAGKELADGTRLGNPMASLNPNEDFTYVPKETAFDAANALTAGKWENDVWKHDMACVIKYLKQLQAENIPVLWRPFHEASGQWFWWGKDADTFKKLWIAMFNEMKAAGLDNLIWVWTSETGDDDWYPGSEYVDIVGRDLYGNDATGCAENYNTLINSSLYGNKIVTLSECGWSDSANDGQGARIADIAEQWAAGAKWAWFMPWYDGADAANKHANEAWWKAAMECDFVISRDKVNF